MVANTYAGPIDHVVFAFPPGAEADAGFTALLDRVDSGTISILDLEVITRGEDGAGRRGTLADLPITNAELLPVFKGAESGILDEEDRNKVASRIDPEWVAVAIVYEERSFATVADTWDRAGGVLLFAGHTEPEELERALHTTEQKAQDS